MYEERGAEDSRPAGVEWPCRCVYPDLSAQAGDLLGAVMLSAVFLGGVPEGDAGFLVVTFVRLVEQSLRDYEAARKALEHASREEKFVAFARAATDMESVFWSLHRAMRVGEALVRSRQMKVSYGALPSEVDRDKLRKMRNAIDHADGPIRLGRAGKGEALALEISSTGMSISDENGVTQTVTHADFTDWLRVVHDLAMELIEHPERWKS